MLTPLKTDDPDKLREYLRDVVALATLPTIWFGAQPLRVAESLAASLFTMLVPELVVVALTGDGDGPPVAIAQTGRYETDPNIAASLQETLFARARSYDPDDLFDLPNPRGSGTLRWAVRAIGHLAELGVLAVAFPDKRDFPASYKLMMGIAATQAATAIQNGRFLRAVRNSEEQVREANRGLEVHLAELQRANARREKAEQALREAQSRLEAALSAGEIGTFVWDVVGDRMYGDRNFDVLFGIPVRADGTAPLADFVQAIHPDDRERTLALVKQTMEAGCDYRAEYRIITGGKVRWVIARGKVEKDASGNVVRFPGVLLDITERKRADDARRDSERRLRALVEATPECVMIVSPEGKLLYMNPAGIGMIEADSMGQVQDACVFDLIGPEHRPQWMEQHRRVCGGERLVWEFQIIGMSGTRRWMETHAVPLPLPDGRNAQLGVTREITARKIAEAERERLLDRERAAREEAETLAEVGRLINGELDLQALVQKVTDATTHLTRAQFGSFFYNVTDEKGESYALYSLSGVPREKFASFPMPRNTQVFAPTFEGKGVIRLDDVTKDPRYGQNPPYYGMPKGHLPVRSYLAVPVTSRSGEVLGGLFFGHSQTGIFTDRDERLVSGIAAQTAVAMDNARLFEAVKRANEMKDGLLASERAARSEAEQASRIKDDFLSTLSHELRTPLNAIIGWSQILQGPSADARDVAEGVKTIERNARAQAQIIEDLLDMSRIISGKLRLDVQRVDLAEVMRAAVETVRPAAQAKEIRIQAVIDPLGGPISGDPNRLQQIFWNLLTNAVKFTPKGGRVQVLLERVNSHVEVSIIDTGEGIAPQFLPHVFDRFRQADASSTRRHGGLGLGLSIVKQLVEMHGGSVRVKSAGLGTGSTFTVALPVLVLHPDPQRPDAEPLQRDRSASLTEVACPELRGVRVVAVDDEPDARALVKRLLEDRGAHVRVAASASEALELMRSDRPDVLVSDIGMPGEDGYALIRKVRALGRDQGCGVPAVALTAYARAEDRMKALAAGFQMHVAKPVEPGELVMVVASLAGRVHA